MLERDCFDLVPFGRQEISYSLDHFVHFIFAGDIFKQFPFQSKIARDVCSVIGYLQLQGKGIAHRV